MAVYLSRGGELQHLGTLHDEYTRTEELGQPVLRRVYSNPSALFGHHVDTIVSAWPTLKPVRRVTNAASFQDDLLFRSDSILGSKSTAAHPPRIVARRADPLLYDGSSFDMLVRLAPLAPAYPLELPSYTSNADTTVTLRARVAGSAPLPHESGTLVDTWVVDMDFAGITSRLWIAKESRQLIRQTIDLAPGVQLLTTRVGVDPAEPELR